MSIAQARQDLVGKIEAEGYSVTDDPRNLTPPCVIVGLPRTITALGNCAYQTEITVTVVAPPPGNADAVNWLLASVEQLMQLLNAERASATSHTVTQKRVPGYELAVPVTA